MLTPVDISNETHGLKGTDLTLAWCRLIDRQRAFCARQTDTNILLKGIDLLFWLYRQRDASNGSRLTSDLYIC